jgi:hypothetical protein
MTGPVTEIRSYDCQDKGRGHYVRVMTDADLAVKFKRGEVLRGDGGSIQVAMVLGIDEMATDRLDVSESSLSMRERLELIKAAVDLALEGCPQ